MQKYLSCAGLSYRLPDGSPLLSSISLTFNAERIGLIGQNGVGKTTLLELLAGLRQPSSGSVTRQANVWFLRQSEPIPPEALVSDLLRVREILAALDRIEMGSAVLADFELAENSWDLPDRIQSAFRKTGIEYLALNRRVDSLSGGELMRLRIAHLLLSEPDFLLLDEPTNHLDLAAREFVYDLVRNWTRGVVVVTHDRTLLSLVDKIAALDRSGIRIYGGNYDFYLEQRAIEESAARAAFEGARQRLRKAESSAIAARERQRRRESSGLHRARRTGMPKMMIGSRRRHAESSSARLGATHEVKVEDARAEVVEAKLRLPVDSRIRVDLAAGEIPSACRMIELQSVTYRYSGSTRDVWLEPLDFIAMGRERIWLKGPNGSGKSTLVDLISERKTPTSGLVHVNSGRIGVLDQSVTVLDDNLTLVENVQRAAVGRTIDSVRTLLGRFLFEQDAALKPTAGLSGGERVRAGLACLLAADQAPEILILDEPTNNLDITSIEAVTSALLEYRGLLLVISHDLYFLRDIEIDKTYDLETGLFEPGVSVHRPPSLPHVDESGDDGDSWKIC